MILPGQLWRLAWPIPLAAVLTLGWVAWEASSRAGAWLERVPRVRPLARALPLLVVVALTVAAVPRTMDGIELVRSHAEEAASSGLYPSDPIFGWLDEEITSPTVVLAKDIPSASIPAFSSEANVVSRRGSLLLRVLPLLEERAPDRIEVPQGSLDVREFFRGTTLARGSRSYAATRWITWWSRRTPGSPRRWSACRGSSAPGSPARGTTSTAWTFRRSAASSRTGRPRKGSAAPSRVYMARRAAADRGG